MSEAPQVVLLAGGRGTRLGDHSKATPKPLISVAGKPFIQHLIEEFRRFGFSRFLVLAGYLGEQMVAFARRGPVSGVSIDVVIEPEPLGTGGALRFAGERLDETFLLTNADSLFAFNYLDLARPPERSEWQAKVALRWVDPADRYGVVETDGDRIVAFAERGGPGRGLINSGLYLLKRETVGRIGPGMVSLEREVFPGLARDGTLFGTVYEGPFIDIGVPETLAASERTVPDILTRPAVFLDRDGVLNRDDNYVHRPEDFHWIPGAKTAVRALNDAGYLVLVVTNQAGVARGYYGEAEVVALHRWINETLRPEGAHVDAFYYCPHHPEGIVTDYALPCSHRKPGPGMLVRAMAEWPIRKKDSAIIGDKPSDIEAGEAAGIAGHLFEGGDLEHFVRHAILKRNVAERD